MEPDDVIEDGRFEIELGKDVSRRKVMAQLGALGAATGLAGCNALLGDQEDGGDGGDGSDGGGDGGSNGDGNASPPADFEFSRHPAVAPPEWDGSKTESGAGDAERTAPFVIQSIDNAFFVPLICGYQDALNQFGWNGSVTGPSGATAGDPSAQIQILNTQVDNLDPGDVLVTTVLDTTAYNDVLQRALDNDIVVINGHTTPATNPPEGAPWNYETMQEEFSYRDQAMIIPHVGIRDARGGAAMAAEAYERLQQTFPDKDELTVLITNELPDNPAVTRRVNANAESTGTAQRYFEAQSNPSVSLYNDQIINPPANIAEAQTEITNTISGQDVDGVICSAFWGAVGAGQALDAGEIEGPMVICGFDLVRPLLNGINDGFIDFTVGQDPYSQGFMNVPLAWMYVNRGIEMKDIEWGVSVWDEENVPFALERRSWADLQSWQNQNYDLG
ncbi:substrate-binding domain-containing protein [Halomicroarcula sp. GCM10025324]|uniref:substrate-binding domain-containing protein n=1 Tax=Haloarcula TaxID=2237 RepID=UPI0023E792CB|nr:substrate-binding domain-containing protein [Halomicroarcula sp. ZS-22-S1]